VVTQKQKYEANKIEKKGGPNNYKSRDRYTSCPESTNDEKGFILKIRTREKIPQGGGRYLLIV